MEREIDDHKKTDLAQIVCDIVICEYRGDYPNCYLSEREGSYKYCLIRSRYKALGLNRK